MSRQHGKSLQDLIDETPDLVDHLYNDVLAPHFRARTGLTKTYVPAEVTNWRDEQTAWRQTAILFDQSHHMPELFLEGPGALRLLERVGVNSFASFTPDRAKQLVACTPRGHVIGDCIVYCLGNNSFELVSSMGLLNWVEYQAEVGGDDVSIVRDDPTPFNPAGRRIKFRFQLDGPHAGTILDRVIEGGSPDLTFFGTARCRIGGREVMILRHGMAGHQGAEISGLYEDMEAVRSTILEVGVGHGLKEGGTRSYFSTVFESGWIAYPLPGIYTDEDLRGFREWLRADGWEANSQLGGSFYSPDIEDYYLTPYELGYGRLVKFDHDFIGRQALEQLAQQPYRQRVTLVWNHEDVKRIHGSQLGPGPRHKALELPWASFGFPHFDEVRTLGGELAGLSTHCGYSNNEGEVLSGDPGERGGDAGNRDRGDLGRARWRFQEAPRRAA